MHAEDTVRLTLEELVEKTTDLPALPAATLAVMRETAATTATAHSVAHYLSQDQALTARVLRLANSAFYGMQRRISSPEEAVVILGMRAVRNLAMIASTYHWMAKPMAGYSLDAYEFWEHSLGVAVASQLIAGKTSPAACDLAFTCGLLHDLGKVALNAWMENRSVTMKAVAAKLDVSVYQAERRILGFDHQEVGGRIAETWNLPKPLVEAILFHHTPSECFPDSTTVDIVHLADYLASIASVGGGGDGLRYKADEKALDRLNLTLEDLNGMSEEYTSTFTNYEKLFAEKAA